MIKLPRWEDWTADFITRAGQQCINIARGLPSPLPGDHTSLMSAVAPLEDVATWSVIIHFIGEVHVDAATRDIARETRARIAEETAEVFGAVMAAARKATGVDAEGAILRSAPEIKKTDSAIAIERKIAALEQKFLAECARVDNIEETIAGMNSAPQESTRKGAFQEYVNRCAANRDVLPQIAQLRLQLARAVGFNSYREYIWAQTPRRMIADPVQFCAEIKPALVAAARAEAQALYHTSEIPYWNWKAGIDSRDESPKTTLRAVLEDFARVFECSFEPLAASVWAADVVCYTLTLRDGRRGVVYMDLYPRDGKFNHAATYLLRAPSAIHSIGTMHNIELGTIHSGHYCSIQAVLCSLSREWTRENKVTLWHELGHVIHHASMRIKYRESVNVEMDFIEVPARLMERYVYPQPPDWAISELRQLVLAEFDLELHGPTPPSTADECAALMRKVFAQTPLRGDIGWFYASFGHYVEMYPAYYYCYVTAGIWADKLYKKISGGRRYADLIPILEIGAKSPTRPALEKFIN